MSRKSDPGRFAREVLGLDLWPHQVEVIASPKPFRAIAAARQTGKSTLLAEEAIRIAFTRPGSTSLLLSATADAAKRLAADVADMLRRAQILDAAVEEENKSRIVLEGGSKIISLPASEKQIRGYTVDGVLIMDEAAFMPEELWRAAFYTVAAVRNPIVYLASTPWGPPDHFFRRLWSEGQAGSEDWASFQWPYTVSPKINKALLEREKERVDPLTYKSEVLGEWVDDAESYFTFEEIMGSVADFPMLPPEEAHGAHVVAGLDYGVRYDSNVLVTVGAFYTPSLENPGVRQPIFIVPWLEEHPAGSMSYADFIERIYQTSTHYYRKHRYELRGFSYTQINSETNGVGAMPTESLARRFGTHPVFGNDKAGLVVGIATSQAYKEKAFGQVKFLLQEGRLVLPRHPGLMKQLSHLRATFTQGGRVSIESDSPAVHDDIADALMHAVAAAMRRQGAGGVLDVRGIPPSREVVRTERGTAVPIPLPLTEVRMGAARILEKPPGF